MMFRTKPVLVDAWQNYTGDSAIDGAPGLVMPAPDWLITAMHDGLVKRPHGHALQVWTATGQDYIGDWIVRDADGNIVKCDAATFAKTYEAVPTRLAGVPGPVCTTVDQHQIRITPVETDVGQPPRWCVMCLSCNELVHASTPRSDAQIRQHLAEPFPVAWQVAARGIPVWPGCHGIAADVPDLEHPDTRIAYIRRLAIALGCPLNLAIDGVIVDWEGRGILICAGVPAIERRENYDPYLVYPWEIEVPNTLVRTRENMALALALAWPAEQRV